MCAPMLPWVARMQKPALLHSFFLPFLFLSGFLLFKDSPLHLQLCLLFLWMALCVGCCLLLGFLPSWPAHNGPGAPLCLPPAPHCPWIPRGLCRKFPVFTPARTSPLPSRGWGVWGFPLDALCYLCNSVSLQKEDPWIATSGVCI